MSEKQVPRPGQVDALLKIIERWRLQEPYTSVVLPTRYGKSDLARAATLVGVQHELITCALVLSPTGFLVRQLVKASKWDGCLQRFSNQWLASNGYKPLTFRPKYTKLAGMKLNPNANGEHFLSASIQLIDRNTDASMKPWCDWVESVRHATGRPVAVIVDESHTGSESNSWGKTLTRMVDAGALAVLLTATPERADGECIPGFEYEVLTEEQVTVTTTAPGPTEEKVTVRLWDAQRRVRRLKADHETTFGQAFSENALSHIGRDTIDVDLSEIAQDSYTGMLSALPQTRVQGALDKLVRHPSVVQKACELLVTNLRQYRQVPGLESTLAIVYCGNDDQRHGASRGDNKHPQQILDELRQVAPELKAEIMTSSDEESADQLIAFADGDGADIAIVKQMAGLGLDSELLKVGLDLSTVRTPAASIQRMMRVATPLPLRAVWITPADCKAEAIFQRLVRDQGGESTRIEDLVLRREYDVPKQGQDAEIWRVGEVTPGAFNDSQEHHGTADEYAQVLGFMEAFPALRATYTDAEIAEGLRGMTTTTDTGPAENTGRQAEALRMEIVETAAGATNKWFRMNGLPYDPRDYGVRRKEVFNQAYRMAGWPTDSNGRWPELKENDNIQQLTLVRDAMQEILADMLRST